MSSTTRSPRARTGLALLVLFILPTTARAQFGGASDQKAAPAVKLKEPVDGRIYQRGADGKADIPIVLDETAEGKDASITGVYFSSSPASPGPHPSARFEDGKLVGVPIGGPYNLSVQVKVGYEIRQFIINKLYVGDLWVLAGQSNMEGVGNLLNVAQPDEQVRLLGMDGKWVKAEEPLHWLVDSPDAVHSGNPDDRAKRSTESHKSRKKGAGLGLAFGKAMAEATKVPVGLVATAHGGTSMEQWSPSKKGEEGKSLYGSFLRQVKLAGGKVKGVLWYQGESDAMNPDATKIYAKTFADFIAAVRDDLGQPDLPFYYVQIGRFINGGNPKNWNAVQDAERLLAERVPNTAVVTGIDLELDDGIHVGTQGLKRLGHRLSKIALRELFGQVGATTPTFDRVNKGPNNTLVVKFKGVNIAAPDAARPSNFPGASPALANPAQAGQFGFAGAIPASGATPSRVVGLKPHRHIAGFSIHKEDGAEVPFLIFDAAVGPARDTVILKLTGPPPEKSFLHYGQGFDPFCNLVDALDMAVPVFGPIPLDDAK